MFPLSCKNHLSSTAVDLSFVCVHALEGLLWHLVCVVMFKWNICCTFSEFLEERVGVGIIGEPLAKYNKNTLLPVDDNDTEDSK